MQCVIVSIVVQTIVLGAVEVLPLARGCLLLHELLQMGKFERGVVKSYCRN